MASVQPVDGVRGEEVGRPILLCRGRLIPLDDIWPQARRFYQAKLQLPLRKARIMPRTE